MRGHNIWFYAEIQKIIPQLSFLRAFLSGALNTEDLGPRL